MDSLELLTDNNDNAPIVGLGIGSRRRGRNNNSEGQLLKNTVSININSNVRDNTSKSPKNEVISKSPRKDSTNNTNNNTNNNNAKVQDKDEPMYVPKFSRVRKIYN